MKTNKLIITLLFALFLTSTSYNFHSKVNHSSKNMNDIQFNSKSDVVSTYTYERVFKDGIWWVYVYDGIILVDYYPE